MYLKIENKQDNDSTTYYAVLRPSQDASLAQKIPVYSPGWDTQSLVEITPAKVFVDPRSSRPLVIVIGEKRLWTTAV